MLDAANATRGTYQAAGLTTRRLDGDGELRKIASAGREWMFKHGRKIDMESEYIVSAERNSADLQSMSTGMCVFVP